MAELIRQVRLVFNKIYIFLFPINQEKRKYIKRNTPDIFGEYPTIKILLEDLDTVFRDIKKLSKNRTSEVQKVIKAYGPHVTCLNLKHDSGDGIYTNKLEGFKAYGLPSFLISYHRVANKKNVQYFTTATKNTRSDFGQRRPGCFYYDVGLSIVDDQLSDINKGKPFDLGYCIEVNKTTGVVRALPYQTTNVVNLRYHNAGGQGAAYHTIPATTWEYPDLHHEEGKTHTQKEIKGYLEVSFCLHYGMVMKRESGINIYVKKNGHRATFSIPHNDWKYFFKDRIKAKTLQGNTKPIYHAVASHFREVNSGTTTVKTHYRGLRHFVWGGYEIKIVMQGKHGISQASFGLEAVDNEDLEAMDKAVDMVKVAGRVNKLFEGA